MDEVEFKERLRTALKNNLTIEVENTHDFTNPNDYKVRVLFDGEEVCEARFSMTVYPEYEG